jgi:Skp family chaperone for outer membrane proteins
MAQAAAAAAQALLDANRQVENSRLPLWSSVKESAFTAEQWIERISRAKQAGNWNDNVTMSYVFNALRGDALTFFDALPTLGYRPNNYDDFKEAFIKTYGTTRTVRTAALNLTDLRQGGSEPASRYIARVIKVVADIQAMAPAVLPQPATPWIAAVTAVGNFNNLDQDVEDEQAQHLIKHGAQDAYHRIGMQLFIAGLRPALRVELMKSNPQTMRQAFDAVIDAEKIISEPQRFGQRTNIMAVSTETEEDEFGGQTEGEQGEEDPMEAEIAALSAKLKKLKKRSQAKSNKANKGGQKQAQNASGRKAAANNGQSGTKPGACRFCKQEGHFQQECYARKNAGAPLVDAQGQPFRTGGVHAVQGGGQHQQQQQQQHYNYNPFAHYAQSDEQAGGVGAIWQRPPPPRWGAGGEQPSFYEQHLNY